MNAHPAEKDAAVTQSVQHRCPQMSRHVSRDPLPKPCPDCYSLRVTAERIPWQPSEAWHSVLPPANGAGGDA